MDLHTTPLTLYKTAFNEEVISNDEVLLDEAASSNKEVLLDEAALPNEAAPPNNEMFLMQMLIHNKPYLLYQAHKSQIHTF